MERNIIVELLLIILFTLLGLVELMCFKTLFIIGFFAGGGITLWAKRITDKIMEE